MKFGIVLVGAFFGFSLMSRHLSAEAATCFLFGVAWATFVACLDLDEIRANMARNKAIRQKAAAKRARVRPVRRRR